VFGSPDPSTEVFRDIELDGDFVPGGEIEVTLEVTQAYPVPLAISCRYENTDITEDQERVAFNERTKSVYEGVLQANPGHEPGDEVGERTIRFTFSESELGDYFIACFTVASPENGIGQGFPIATEDIDPD
jgi:hypothetical protein